MQPSLGETPAVRSQMYHNNVRYLGVTAVEMIGQQDKLHHPCTTRSSLESSRTERIFELLLLLLCHNSFLEPQCLCWAAIVTNQTREAVTGTQAIALSLYF